MVVACMGAACVSIHSPDHPTVSSIEECRMALNAMQPDIAEILEKIWGIKVDLNSKALKLMGSCIPEHHDDGLPSTPDERRI